MIAGFHPVLLLIGTFSALMSVMAAQILLDPYLDSGNLLPHVLGGFPLGLLLLIGIPPGIIILHYLLGFPAVIIVFLIAKTLYVIARWLHRHRRLVRPVIVGGASAVIVEHVIAPAAIDRYLLDIGAAAIAISTTALLHWMDTAATVLTAIAIFLVQQVESATGLTVDFIALITLTGVLIGMAQILIPWWSIDRTIIQPILGAIGTVLGTAVVMRVAVDTVTTSAQMAVTTIVFATGIGLGVELVTLVIRPNFQTISSDVTGYDVNYRSNERSQSRTDRNIWDDQP